MAGSFLVSLIGLSIIIEMGASVLEIAGFVGVMGLVTYGTYQMIRIFDAKSIATVMLLGMMVFTLSSCNESPFDEIEVNQLKGSWLWQQGTSQLGYTFTDDSFSGLILQHDNGQIIGWNASTTGTYLKEGDASGTLTLFRDVQSTIVYTFVTNGSSLLLSMPSTDYNGNPYTWSRTYTRVSDDYFD